MVEKSISFSIWGNKFSSDGYQQLLRIGSVGALEDVVYPEFTDNGVYFSVINKTDKVVYALTKSNISSYDGGRVGRLRIGIAIPKGFRISQARSPYALLKELYDHYCVGYLRIIGNSTQFKQELERSEEFKEIFDRYPLEVYNGPWKPMNEGASAKAYVILSEDKIAELFKDTQYEELREYNELIVASAGSSMQFAKLNLEVPRVKKYKVYRNGEFYTTVTGRSFAVTAPESSRRGYRFLPAMVSTDIDKLSDGKSMNFDGCTVILDEMNETIHCDFSEKAVEVSCRVTLVGADQRLYSKLTIQAGYAAPIMINDAGTFKVSGNDLNSEWTIKCADPSYELLTPSARINPDTCTIRIELQKKQLAPKVEERDRVHDKVKSSDKAEKTITVQFEDDVPSGELYLEFNLNKYYYRIPYGSDGTRHRIDIDVPVKIINDASTCKLYCKGYDIGDCKVKPSDGKTVYSFSCVKSKKKKNPFILLSLVTLILGLLIGGLIGFAVQNSFEKNPDSQEGVIPEDEIQAKIEDYRKLLEGLKSDPKNASFETWDSTYRFVCLNAEYLHSVDSLYGNDSTLLSMTNDIISKIKDGNRDYFSSNFTYSERYNNGRYNLNSTEHANRTQFRDGIKRLLGEEDGTMILECIDAIALGKYTNGMLVQYGNKKNSGFINRYSEVDCFYDLKRFIETSDESSQRSKPIASTKINIRNDAKWTSLNLTFDEISKANSQDFDNQSQEILNKYKVLALMISIDDREKHSKNFDRVKQYLENNDNLVAFSEQQQSVLKDFFLTNDTDKKKSNMSNYDQNKITINKFNDFISN